MSPLVRASVRPSVGSSPGLPGSAAGGTRGWAGPGRGREEEPERQVRDPGAGGRGGKGGGGTRTPRPSTRPRPPGAPCGRSPTPAPWAPWTRSPHPRTGALVTGRRIGSPSPVGMYRATKKGEVLRSSRGRLRCTPAAGYLPASAAAAERGAYPGRQARVRIPSSSAGPSGLGECYRQASVREWVSKV